MLKLLLGFGFELFTLSILPFALYANYPSGACLKAGLYPSEWPQPGGRYSFCPQIPFKLKNSLGKKLPFRSLSQLNAVLSDSAIKIQGDINVVSSCTLNEKTNLNSIDKWTNH